MNQYSLKELYFENDRLSQSKLKLLKKGPESLKYNNKSDKELFYKEKGHFIIGSGVDFLLSYGVDEFNEEYYILSESNRPSENILNVLHEVLELSDDLEASESLILNILKRKNLYSKMSNEKKISRVINEKTIAYFNAQKEMKGKIVITDGEKESIFNIYNKFVNNENCAEIINQKTDNNKIVINQFDTYFTFKDVECKALMDKVIFTKNKDGLIYKIEIFDFKTTSFSVNSFEESFYKFGYNIQASWYTLAMEKYIKENTSKFFAENVEIESFKFLVASSNYDQEPAIYAVLPETLSAASEEIDILMEKYKFLAEFNLDIDRNKFYDLKNNNYKFYTI